jgi:hypothetical protein
MATASKGSGSARHDEESARKGRLILAVAALQELRFSLSSHEIEIHQVGVFRPAATRGRAKCTSHFHCLATVQTMESKMKFFIEVIGSMDQVLVGPFDDRTAAELHAATISERFERFVLDENEMKKSIETYGAIPIQSP